VLLIFVVGVVVVVVGFVIDAREFVWGRWGKGRERGRDGWVCLYA
jgi:hypothetical protein